VLKKLICLMTSLCGASAPGEPIEAFLDKEQRPGAKVVTESFVEFGALSDRLEVKGVLGAIRSERKPDTYVAFSGVEISKSYFQVDDMSEALNFKISSLQGVGTLTVQLVLKRGSLYAIDLPLKGPGELKLPLSSFKESYRGRIGDLSFSRPAETIKTIRFFLKRSENLPFSKEPLEFSFSLADLKIVK